MTYYLLSLISLFRLVTILFPYLYFISITILIWHLIYDILGLPYKGDKRRLERPLVIFSFR